MADRAHITPKVLKWARESARMSEENAASKISVSVQSKIPNVCDNMNIKWINDFRLVDELGLVFKCEVANNVQACQGW